MRVPSYLVQSRCNVFYFRWPLPSSIHPHAKRRDIKVSLRTRTPHKALQLSRYLAYLADILTSEALASGMRYDEIRRTLKTAFKEALSRKKAKIDAQGRLKPLEITSLQNSLAFAEEALKNDTALSGGKYACNQSRSNSKTSSRIDGSSPYA
ncbi:MAG: DUF6538 domain-containing protein [Terasakiella sp.]|uniref:DUF6538 domain-containing protein n=1 Tax=unclassified Terasakiella TaxID=2614952 RepID=UPI003B0012D0